MSAASVATAFAETLEASPILVVTLTVVVVSTLFFLWVTFGNSNGPPPVDVAKNYEEKQRAKPKVRDITLEELAKYDGKEGSLGCYVCCNGVIFDMLSAEGGKEFYTAPSPYAVFAGRDATYGLGSLELDASKWKPKSELTVSQIDVAEDWQRKFEAKYDVVGRLVEAGTEAAATPAPESEDDEPAAAPQQ